MENLIILFFIGINILLLSLRFKKILTKFLLIVIIVAINFLIEPFAFAMAGFIIDSPSSTHAQYLIALAIFIGIPNLIISLAIGFCYFLNKQVSKNEA